MTLFETEGASLWLGDTCVASVGQPLSEGVTAQLAEGDGIEGRLVLSATALDEDRERLLASFAYQASVALQKARLYRKQLEAAEIANALLEASRELATAETPDEVLARSVEVTARVLGTERAALWIQEEAAPGDLVARASNGYAPDADPASGRRFPGKLAREWLEGRTEPFVLEPDVVAHIDGVDDERIARFVIAPLRLEGNRVGALTVTTGDRDLDDRQLRLLDGLAHQAKLAIESAENFESLERTFVSTVASLANALEANDAYTSSHARWITDMALLVGRELRLDRDTLKRLELARALPRHRQDRDSVRDPAQARAADGRGVRDRQAASGAGREDPRADRPARRRPPDRARLPRALGRARLPGRQGRHGDPARGAHRARL